MTIFDPLSVLLAIYAIVLLFFVAMTRREQKLDRGVTARGAIVGFGLCLVWPVTVVMVLFLRARAQARSRRLLR